MNTIKDETTRDYLISLVRERDVLWNPQNAKYKDNKESQKQWLEIAQIIGYSVQICRATWRYLRDVYMSKKKKSPSGSAGGKKPVWVHMVAMTFIDDVLKPRETTSNMPEFTQYSEDPDDFPHHDDNDIEEYPFIHSPPDSQEIFTPSFSFVASGESSLSLSHSNRHAVSSGPSVSTGTVSATRLVNTPQAPARSGGRLLANVTSRFSDSAEDTEGRAYSSQTPKPAYIIEVPTDEECESMPPSNSSNSSESPVNRRPASCRTNSPGDGSVRKRPLHTKSPVNGLGHKKKSTAIAVQQPTGTASSQATAQSSATPMAGTTSRAANSSEGKKKNNMTPFQQLILSELSVADDSDTQWLNSLKPLLNLLPLIAKESAKIEIHSHLLKLVNQHLSGQEESP